MREISDIQWCSEINASDMEERKNIHPPLTGSKLLFF